MDIREISMQLESPLFRMRKLIERAEYIMQDVLEDYFFMEEKDEHKLAVMLAYGFKRNGSKAEAVDDTLHLISAQLKALEELAKKVDEALAAEGKKTAA